jgi:hypothetical protein
MSIGLLILTHYALYFVFSRAVRWCLRGMC